MIGSQHVEQGGAAYLVLVIQQHGNDRDARDKRAPLELKQAVAVRRGGLGEHEDGRVAGVRSPRGNQSGGAFLLHQEEEGCCSGFDARTTVGLRKKLQRPLDVIEMCR